MRPDPSPPSAQPAPPLGELVHLVRSAEVKVRTHLNELGNRKLRWLVPDHPIKTKNLEKIAGHLQNVLVRLVRRNPDGSSQAARDTISASLSPLLDQVEEPKKMAFDSAWEVADLLELELLQLADDTELYMLLIEEQTAAPRYAQAHLEALIAGYAEANGQFKDDKSRSAARRALEHLQQARISEYRRDRAKAKLRGIYLTTMAGFLGIFAAGMCYFYLTASRGGETSLLLLVVFSGAAGSVLSRAVKLGKQPLHANPDAESNEPPLGIRALLSGWKVFFAQPVIGATAALILFLTLQAGLFQFGKNQTLGPAGMGLLGFLAGFSEPFFLGVLDKVTGQGQGSRS